MVRMAVLLIMENSNYQGANQELFQLHMERLRRKGEQMQSEDPPKALLKQQKKEERPPNPYGEIYLNSIIYDKRPNQAKTNNITFAQLLHEDISVFPTRPISKGVEGLLITTFGYQPEVFQPIVRSKVPFIIVNREGQQKDGYFSRSHQGFQNLTLVSPPKVNMGYGVFHTKLWLVKFNTFLRVVVCTGNNHLADWAIWQNAYWYHDCPTIAELSKESKEAEHKKDEQGGNEEEIVKDFDFQGDFKDTLKWVLSEMQPKGMEILKQMKIDLQRYSFKGINVILIPSVPGRFKGSMMDKVGLGKVRKVMNKCTKQFKKPIMTYNSTSLGKLDEKFIRQVFVAFNPKGLHFAPNKFRLVYPTDKYIREETSGEAQVLFLIKENYDKSDIKAHIFYRYEESLTNGVLGGIPHLKTLIVEDEEQDRCMLYLGSHNLTKAAWGTYEKEGTQISCSNSELGLLFVDYSKKELGRWLPYRFPPSKYLNTDRPFCKMID